MGRGLGRARSVPWLVLLRVAHAVWERVQDDLTAADRRRLGQLVRRRPDRLTRGDIAELRRILGKIDLRKAGNEVAAAGGRGRRR